MNPAARRMFDDLPAWQAMLDRYQELFSDMLPGSCIGILPRSGTGLMPGKHLAGLSNAEFRLPDGKMLAWEISAEGSGMRADFRACRKFDEARADLLLVPDDAAFEEIRRNLGSDPLSTIKKMIRCGNILFFVMKTKHQLQDAGYEDFLDTLGLAFLGACR
ncbi:MAG: hypothetical protein A3G25_03265 [Betaproteobacteria bacterium RIFCSPLOWO2_12_FULL_63_13]|nr:MAG: hypothetical protein A3G25_03265 [Betaproteobacteria bacterium RIFCSPLOWO2_12_FULL_63_13]